MSATSNTNLLDPNFAPGATPTVSEIANCLAALGFTRHRIPGSHYYFDRPDTEACFALPDMENAQRLWPPNLGFIRSRLDAFGIVPRREFNEWLGRNATMAAKTGTHD